MSAHRRPLPPFPPSGVAEGSVGMVHEAQPGRWPEICWPSPPLPLLPLPPCSSNLPACVGFVEGAGWSRQRRPASSFWDSLRSPSSTASDLLTTHTYPCQATTPYMCVFPTKGGGWRGIQPGDPPSFLPTPGGPDGTFHVHLGPSDKWVDWTPAREPTRYPPARRRQASLRRRQPHPLLRD